MELTSVNISEVVFKERLSSRQFCVIFLVVVRGLTCVMKVHHGRGSKLEYEPRHRETNIYICESTAYRRLRKAGLCARGIVPQFYGTMEKIDPTLCEPHLKNFVKDKYRPTAIFLEYIPNIKELHWTNYKEKRMQKFVDGIDAIHGALVEHGDVHPRNMMIVEGEPERAIWIDFDRAQTFDGDFTQQGRNSIAEEKAIVLEIARFMVLQRTIVAMGTKFFFNM